MCGITGYIGKNKNAIEVVINGLEALEYRGYDSAGIAYINNNKLNIIKEKGKIINLKSKINFNIFSNMAIGHTRWATHGEPNKINSHPHTCGKFTIVHNGIIENYLQLKEELEKNGYSFQSETDTEIAVCYINYIYNIENDILKTLNKITKIFRGSYAFGIICLDDLKNLYAVRKTSPLIIAHGENENFIASDVPAILKYTNKYILLDDYEIAKINDTNITIYDKDLNEINKNILEFEGTYESSIKSGYEHFMLKEIHEEPIVFKNTMSEYLYFKNIPDLTKYNNIHIVACGSAYHAGLIGKYLIEKFTDIPVYVEVASEYRYKKNFYDKDTLVIFVSQSGETADTLACLRKVKENNIDTLSIVNVVGSSIARESKYVIYTKAGCEIAVATTKAYLAQITVFSILTMYLTNTLSSNLMDEINKLPQLLEDLINFDYKLVANQIYKNNNIFFIGRSIDYYLCMEGSLKLKEISYINSSAYQAGELKHGTISLIEKDTPVIAISTDNNLIEKTISNIKEVKARGAKVIFVTNNNTNNDFYDYIINVPKLSELLQPIITILPLQIISYEVAKLRGCDIDKPRNLAKSVTVE